MSKTKHRIFNPTILFIIMLGIGLPLSFSHSVQLNIVIIVIMALYLCWARVNPKTALLALLIALPLAFGSWASFMFFGVGDRVHTAWVYGTRVYAYLLLAMILTMTSTVQEILLSLHHHLHLSNTFVYGLLASFNMMKNLRDQYRKIKYSAMLRDSVYHFWQPHFYLRLIITALNWSSDLAIAMTSQGFTEGAERTELATDPLPAWQWFVAIFLIIAYCLAAFVWQPW